jgi:DNA-nicking Smr family endonuclease
VNRKKKKNEGSPFAGLEAMREKIQEKEAAASSGAKSGAKAAPAPKKKIKVDAREEEVSFHRLMSGVTPLDASGPSRVAQTATAASASRTRDRARAHVTREQEENVAIMEHLRTLVAGATRFEVSDDGVHAEGKRAEVQPAVLRRLRHGQFAVDGRLDLHGLRAEEAKATVTKFLAEKRARRERCVLVIHGKGTHSEGDAVLRGELSAWLSQGPASHHVAAFCTATREDGGTGATYVLLLN